MLIKPLKLRILFGCCNKCMKIYRTFLSSFPFSAIYLLILFNWQCEFLYCHWFNWFGVLTLFTAAVKRANLEMRRTFFFTMNRNVDIYRYTVGHRAFYCIYCSLKINIVSVFGGIHKNIWKISIKIYSLEIGFCLT